MKRTPVTIIAVAVALILTAAFGSASASASAFVTDEPASITGTSTETTVLTMAPYSFACFPTGLGGSIGNPTMELSVEVEAGTCQGPMGKGPLEMNGCGFTFHPGAETATDQFSGTLDIGPPGCGPIEMVGADAWCGTRVIPAQTGLSKATFDNEGSGSEAVVGVTLKAYFKYEPTKKCSGGTGVWSGSWELSAENKQNEPIGIRVDQTGIFMSGEESESEEEQPRFDAEVDPESTVVSLFGSEDPEGTHTFTRDKRSFSCTDVNYEGRMVLGFLLLDTEYNECTSKASGSVVEVKPACPYLFNVFNVGPPYTGGITTGCGGESELVIKLWLSKISKEEGKEPTCMYEFEQQELVPGVGYSTVGEGNERGINIDLGVEELVSTRTKGSTLLCGAAVANTTYTGSATVFGVS
jgi:hypothetical protein